MRILVAGDWHSELHEQAVFTALAGLGHQVEAFAWHSYFDPGSSGGLRALAARAQNRYLFGPAIARLNRDLLARARGFEPDLVFIYRGTHVWPATVDALRQARGAHAPPVAVLGYNNDDPFAPRQPASVWRHFLSAVPRYDAVLAYREHNLAEYLQAGARRVHLLRSWFMPERNHPLALDPDDRQRFGCDVVFVGHHEDDGRTEALAAIASAGIDLRLFGPGYEWDAILARSGPLRHLAPVRLVWGQDYNKALCGARIALCFLSKLNRDTYTRRCFEIPASGTMMLSEHSDDLATLFAPGVEADYFRDTDELLARLRLYLGDEPLRARVAAAGARRVHADGHDVSSRMRALLEWVATWHAPGAAG